MANLGYLPASIIAGESIWISASNTTQATNADIILTDYTPADGYTLGYDFNAPTPITIAGVANGADTGWTLELTAAQTLLWKAGLIHFAGYVTKTSSSRKFAVDAGAISVAASPLATSAWTAIVTALDAAILEYAATPVGSFSVDGVNINYRSMEDLTNLRAYAKTMADSELGSRQKRIIRARFT